jgi:uncharacterized membrane protein YfcA
MSETLTLFAVFLIGVAAAMIGATVGGGSLLSIPVLIFLGLPPQAAIATDRLAGLGAAVTALYKFWKAGKIVWRLVPLLTVLSLVGSLIGATILINIDPSITRYVVGGLVILLLPVLFLKRDVGLHARRATRSQVIMGSILYLFIQILAGFFGGGTGTLIFYTLMLFFGVTIIQVAATQIIPFFVLTVSSTALFASHGFVISQNFDFLA